MQNRILYLDYSRLFVAFLVVLGHMLPVNDQNIRPFIYAFHMPFFCLASGILHKYNGTIQFKKYLRTIIRPYLFFNLLFLIIHPLMFKLGFTGQWNVPNVLSSDDFLSILTSFFYTHIQRLSIGFDGPTWFLLIILWCKIGLDSIMNNKFNVFIFIILSLFLFLCHNNFFYLRQALQLFPFFFVGFYYKNMINHFMLKGNHTILFLLFLFLTIILTMLNGRVTWLGSTFGQLSFPFNLICSYINAFIGSFAFLFLSTLFKKNQVVIRVALSLITILCVQNLFIYTYRSVLGFSGTYVIEIMISIAILFICVIVHSFLSQKTPWIYGKSTINL